MASRALIIAIEKYPNAEGIPKALPGTLKSALNFRQWLEAKWKADGRKPAETQILFCSSPTQPGGTGASRQDIVTALTKLKQDGRGMTEELFVFFSGHGFAFVNAGTRADILISADFQRSDVSGPSCLKIDEMISWLRDHLGPGCHFYFVDACRNTLDSTQVAIGPLLPFERQALPEASTFLLQSTLPGATAQVRGAFPKILLAGLRGEGKAKCWEPGVADAMFVKYDSLRTFLTKQLRQQQPITSHVDGDKGENEVVLATLRPVPKSTCRIQIKGTSANDAGNVIINRGRSPVGEKHPFKKQPSALALDPDDYVIGVELNNADIAPGTAVAADLYEDQTLQFTKVSSRAPRPPAAPPPPAGPSAPSPPSGDTGQVHVSIPSNGKLTLRNLNNGQAHIFTESATVSLPAGSYHGALRDQNQLLIKQGQIAVTADKTTNLDLANWQSSVPHQSIAKRLPLEGGSPDFSESLQGAVTDPDLGLWLAILGGGRILGSLGDYSKLVNFPLHDFSNEPPGASPVYVLAGFENPAIDLTVGISQPPGPRLVATQPPDMPGIREWYMSAPPGQQLVTLQVGGAAPYTIASLASPNRVMLITLTLDEDELRIAQYLLPLGHLINQLDPTVQARLNDRNQLRDLRFLAQASRAFRKRRSVPKNEEFNALLYGKWLDPIGSALACYELIRRGRAAELQYAIANMLQYFGNLPDSTALAVLAGQNLLPTGTPLFLDGLLAFPSYERWLPLPASRLDFRSPWTAWRDATK